MIKIETTLINWPISVSLGFGLVKASCWDVGDSVYHDRATCTTIYPLLQVESECEYTYFSSLVDFSTQFLYLT